MKYLPLLLLLTSCSMYNKRTINEGDCYSDGYYHNYKVIKTHRYGFSTLDKSYITKEVIRKYFSYDNNYTDWMCIDCEVVEEFK